MKTDHKFVTVKHSLFATQAEIIAAERKKTALENKGYSIHSQYAHQTTYVKGESI